MVEVETINEVMYEGDAFPISVKRQRNGVWHVTFRANMRVLLGDRREVWVTREFRIRATDYKGHPAGKASTKYKSRAAIAKDQK